MEKRHIVYFSGSSTHGYRASDGGRYDEQEHWTYFLQKQLGNDYLIAEEGLSGRTTRFSDPIREGLSGLDHICPCLVSHEPVDLLAIVLGTNDAKECFGTSVACIALGLERLIVRATSTFDAWRTGRASILMVTPRSIDERYEATQVGKTTGMGCAEKSEGLARESEGVASQMGCHYLGANTVATEQNHCDFIHLAKEGHQELADASTEVISSLFNSQ